MKSRVIDARPRVAATAGAIVLLLVLASTVSGVVSPSGRDNPSAPKAAAGASGTGEVVGLNDPSYADVIGTIAIRPSSATTTTYTSDLRSVTTTRVLVSGVSKGRLTAVKSYDSNSFRLAQWAASLTTLYRVSITYFAPGTRTPVGSISWASMRVQSVRSGGVGGNTSAGTPLDEAILQAA
jgi:hypothetical protein